MPKSTLKMSIFYVYVSFLKETRVCTRLALDNTRVCLKYATFCIETCVYLLMYATVSKTHLFLLKIQKNTYFEIRIVWVVMQLTPSVVTTLSSTLTLHKEYK